MKQLSALVTTGTVVGGTGLRDRLSRYWSKGLNYAESRLYLASDSLTIFLLLWCYKLCKMMMMCLNQSGLLIYTSAHGMLLRS